MQSRVRCAGRLCRHIHSSVRRTYSTRRPPANAWINGQHPHGQPPPSSYTGFDLRDYRKEDDLALTGQRRGPGIGGPSENTQRYYMYQALRRIDANEVWKGFNGILSQAEWHKVSEYDVIRIMQIMNRQYHFERDPTILRRLKTVTRVCEEKGLRFTTTWAFNELIRIHLAEGRRDLADKIKKNIDSNVYGPEVTANVHTYAALFSDPFASSLTDLGRLTKYYDEMLGRNIEPSVQIQKCLIRAARRAGEFNLLSALLSSTSMDSVPYSEGIKAARFAAARAHGHIALHKLNNILADLRKLLMYQIPKDIRTFPEASEYEDTVQIPMALSDTRQAFFLCLRSLYESLIRMHLIRGKGQFAKELLDELRRDCYLPPTQQAYTWFVKFYAKRKNIDQLWEIHTMMLQDGVPFNEHIYTKMITACMFTPKKRLLNVLAQRVIAKNKQKTAVSDSARPFTEADLRDLEAAEKLHYNEANSGLPKIPEDVKTVKDLNQIVFRPRDCIRFFNEQLREHNVRSDDIRNKAFCPNIATTNAVMRAYRMLDKPKLALREFNRYCYHQKRMYPAGCPPEVDMNRRTVNFLFHMAIELTNELGRARDRQTVVTTMLEWGLNAKAIENTR